MRLCFFAATLVCFGVLICGSCSSKGNSSGKAADAKANSSKVSSVEPKESPVLPAEPKVRRFTFHYAFKVKGLQPAQEAGKGVVRVWLPCAASSAEQDVRRLAAIAPAEISEQTEARFGNRVLFFETRIPSNGEFAVDVPYAVTRREVLRGPSALGASAALKLDAVQRAFLLRADSMVPIAGKPLKLLDGVELRRDKLSMARQLYDIVDDHVTYRKDGAGWGRGDSNWVCESGYGNCTDFHSLFISLARSQGLPCRFEIGFSIPTDKSAGPITGYHCWAWFYADERGWLPVDISEASKNPKMRDYYFGNLTADRVTFSIGRDLKLIPQSKSPPLNFFIYPHIEVDGEVLPKANVEQQFTFQDET